MLGVGLKVGVLEGRRVRVGVASGVRGVWLGAGVALAELVLLMAVGLVLETVYEGLGRVGVGWAACWVASRRPASTVIASTVGRYSVG